MSTGKPTIDDVAKLAGVGRATVSRVLNNGPNVSPEVRELVLKTVKRLNYKVNAQARFLAGGKAQAIALVYAADPDSEPNSYYHSALELGAMRVAGELGFKLAVHTVNEHSLSRAQAIVDLTEDQRCDGIILTPPFSDDLSLLKILEVKGIQVVGISSGPKARSMGTGVGIDDEAAGYELARYMLSLGHRRYAYIDGSIGHFAAAERLSGFRRAMAEAAVTPDDIMVVQGSFNIKSGVDQAQAIFRTQFKPDAIVCANDDMAVGALFAAHNAGIDIPRDLSIVGFDDTPISATTWPPLTTVHQPLKSLGRRAVEILVEKINTRSDQKTTRYEILGHRIVMRQSASPRPRLS